MEPVDYCEVLTAFRKIWKIRAFFTTQTGLTAREIFLLNLIADLSLRTPGDKPGIRISELGFAAGMSKSAVSQLLRILEKKGLILRCADSEDRRAILISLSQSGAGQLEQSVKSCRSLVNRITEKLGPEDTAELKRLFGRIHLILCQEGNACRKG